MNYKIVKNLANNKFARNSLILFIGVMIANFFGYLFHLVIGRMVGVEVYGEVESLTAVIGIISIPTAALSMVATKYSSCSKAEDDPSSTLSLFKYLNKKVITYGLPFFILALLLTPFFKNFLKIESSLAIIIIWISMLLSFFASITGGILAGWQKFYASSVATVLGSIIKLISVIVLILLGFRLVGIMGSFALGVAVSYGVTFFYIKFIFKSQNGKSDIWQKITQLIPVKKYVLPVFFGNLSIAILGNIDMVLAKHNLSPFEAGQYGALTIVSKIIFFATGSLATVLFSMSAERAHKNNDSMRIFKYAFALIILACIVAIIIYFVFPEFILGMLFGNKYADISGYLGWFAILASCFSIANLMSFYLLSVHHLKFVYSYLIISILATIILLFVGKTISAILEIMIAAQILTVFLGFYSVLKTRKRHAEIDINYSPGLQ